jgi:AraC family transcriptional regulator of adaptative response/methylated-DNA-[protein]-cysteine methyltransferase
MGRATTGSTMKEPDMTQEQLWEAVSERRRKADGAFVYAVRSTGIYCRPSCPSRRPRRDRVEFFPLPEAAERAGYRACRRCRPRDVAASVPALDHIRRACRAIERGIDEEGAVPSLADLAAETGTGPHHLLRLFQRHLGITPREFADSRRLGRVKVELREGAGVAQALYGAGYGSPSRLYERAGPMLGMTPASYAKGGKGARIAFTIAACEFGRVLVAATEKGLCAVSLGEDDAVLEAAFRAEYPLAEIVADEAVLAPVLSGVLKRLAGEDADAALPLDLRATAFQWRVWQALREIPRGETATYSAIARKLGAPKATRAVARACASNQVAVVIPCHRVVREDGTLGGYRWGLQRKEELLSAERKR